MSPLFILTESRFSFAAAADWFLFLFITGRTKGTPAHRLFFGRGALQLYNQTRRVDGGTLVEGRPRIRPTLLVSGSEGFRKRRWVRILSREVKKAAFWKCEYPGRNKI
jgi:hypothetical protein